VADRPICVTCGVAVDLDRFDPDDCAVCSDDRQYVGYDGQQWTTMTDLASDHVNVIREESPGLWGVGTEPSFAIAQRALIVPGEGGNLLWDCVSLVDGPTVDRVNELGGLAAIAISHPHYYSSMVEWSEAFGGVPIYLHSADEQWIRASGNTRLWDGDTTEILPGRTLVNPRVHFAGGSVLHWPGIDGRGALCTGDIVQVVADHRWVSFMYSYPNLVPEHPDTVRRTVELLAPFDFETIYGAWWGRVVPTDAKRAVTRSARRYLEHLGLTL
jgi:glyoxylase-like metal-dependent hydrolase (beta-lactamase superfamily II)